MSRFVLFIFSVFIVVVLVSGCAQRPPACAGKFEPLNTVSRDNNAQHAAHDGDEHPDPEATHGSSRH